MSGESSVEDHGIPTTVARHIYIKLLFDNIVIVVYTFYFFCDMLSDFSPDKISWTEYSGKNFPDRFRRTK